jgi:uncharacterized protein (TIGR03435 family)
MDFADATLARFDVLAKGAQNATKAELFLMIQPLLVDRFKLKLHRETRELPYYELLVAKNGSKLDKAEEGHCAAALKAAKPCGNMLEFTNGLVADNLTLPAIPRALGRILEDRPVIDKPGLAGTFDIHVMWKRADRKGAESEQERPAVDEVPDSVFVALQEQAGLRLAAAKGPVQVLVIDSVEKPSAN